MNLSEFYDQYTHQLEYTLGLLDQRALESFAATLYEAYQNEKQIFVLGNGGSAACATHWVCDFNKGVTTPRSKRAKLISLSDNTGIVTALGNDVSYHDIFSYQLRNFAAPGDVVVVLSVSGNSANLTEAVEYAKSINCHTLAALGGFDGKIGGMVDTCLWISSRNYGIVEDIHLILNHLVSQYFRERNLSMEASYGRCV